MCSHVDSQCSDVISSVEGTITVVLQSVHSVSATQQPVMVHDAVDTAAPAVPAVSTMSTPAVLEDAWQPVVRRKIRLRDAKVSTDASDVPRAVPHKPVLAAFVGRLYIDTTEEGLAAYLQ